MKKNFRIQINTKDERVFFCDVSREKDVNEIIESFHNSENTNQLKIFGKKGDEFFLIEKINKVKMGF